MRRIASVLLFAILGLALAAVATAASHEGDDQAQTKAPPMAFDQAPPVGTKATCPVSRRAFTVQEGTARSQYKGKHYAFCCEGCKPKFDADPEKYLGEKPGDSSAHHTH